MSARLASRALRVNVLRQSASAAARQVASRRALSTSAVSLRDASKLAQNQTAPHYEKIRGQQKVFASADEAVADLRECFCCVCVRAHLIPNTDLI